MELEERLKVEQEQRKARVVAASNSLCKTNGWKTDKEVSLNAAGPSFSDIKLLLKLSRNH